MTNPDYRAMCAELVDSLHKHTSMWEGHEIDLVTRARALLDQPVAEGPTDEEIYNLFDWLKDEWQSNDEREFPLPLFTRAVLAKWGHPIPQPEETDIHYTWDLLDVEGEWQAGGSAITLESVRREGNHYLQTYSQDGFHTLIIYRASTIEVVTND